MTTTLVPADKKPSAPADRKPSAPWNEAATERAVRRFLAADSNVRDGEAMAEKGRWLRAEIAQEAYHQGQATFDVFSQGVNRSTTWLSDCAATARIFPTTKDRDPGASCRDHFRAQRAAGKFPKGDTDEGRRKIALHWLGLKAVRGDTMGKVLEAMTKKAVKLHEEAAQKEAEEEERERREAEAKDVAADDALMTLDHLLEIELQDRTARREWMRNLGEILGKHLDDQDVRDLSVVMSTHGLLLAVKA